MYISICDRKTALVEKRDFESLVSELTHSPHQSVFFCNVHMLMLSQEDSDLANAMDGADRIFADGAPIAWLQRRISKQDAQVIRGYEVLLAVCKHAVRNGEKVGFIGSTLDVMKGLVTRLSGQFTDLNVTYQHCPPYSDGELISPSEELQGIRASGINWLFVGLGCPKQEKWIARYADELDCNILGVGAAFDWLSVLTRKPPSWMERLALGWFYRLLTNPKKMWRRYLIYNTKFLFRIPGELYRARKDNKQRFNL